MLHCRNLWIDSPSNGFHDSRIQIRPERQEGAFEVRWVGPLGPLDLRILMANFLPVDSQTFQGDDLLLVSSQVCIQATIPDYQCIWGTPTTDKEAYTLRFFIDLCDDLCLVLLSRCFLFHLGLDARLVNLCIKIG